MAKGKQDFYNEGVASAKQGNTRSPGGEHTMPVFGESGSWQGNAFAEGFRDQVKAMREKEEALDFACKLEAERTARDLETVGTTEVVELRVPVAVAEAVKANPKGAEAALNKYGYPVAVIEHINFLGRQAATCSDEARRNRLRDKSIALKNKWTKRVTAAHQQRILRA